MADMSHDEHLLGAFRPTLDEVDLPATVISGVLPPELDGEYLRNGPNPRFTPVGSYLYPLEGDGMVHAVMLRDGQVRYRNRFVRTPMIEREEAAGHVLWPGLMSGRAGQLPTAEEVGPDLAGSFRDMPDINVVRHSGRVMAMAEGSTPFCLGPDLATLGRETFDGALPVGMTAHPKIDPVTGEMLVFCYMLEAPYLTWSIIDRTGRVVRADTPVAGVDRPVMIHDMALTEHSVVLVLSPLFFDVMAAMRGGSMLSWEPDEGTRVAIVPRDGSPVRWAHGDTFWTWHMANAFSRPGQDGSPSSVDSPIVLDMVQHSDPGMGMGRGTHTSAFVRTTVDPVAGTIAHEEIEAGRLEFPRIDDRRLGSAHRRVAVGYRTATAPAVMGAFDAVRVFDTATGSAQQWTSDGLVGEPSFAPRPGSTAPDDGWWLDIVADPAGVAPSRLVVLDAADVSAGPVATVQLPVRVPLGLHGNWLPGQE
ncbi:carotenoid oxygenase family protein [Nakamurella flavida]|uniref:Dioxygenase n=1 Tax=Nakamurella flavida TaxID=363630 RepID=A0A939C1C6_9ACTN|nr:carotenoid oxygenase family protein [Nakamurella flavida]